MWFAWILSSARSVIRTVTAWGRREMSRHPATNAIAKALPALCGADIELGNFIAGAEHARGTGYEASRALLAEIKGLPIRQTGYLDNWWTASYSVPRAGATAALEPAPPPATGLTIRKT